MQEAARASHLLPAYNLQHVSASLNQLREQLSAVKGQAQPKKGFSFSARASSKQPARLQPLQHMPDVAAAPALQQADVRPSSPKLASNRYGPQAVLSVSPMAVFPDTLWWHRHQGHQRCPGCPPVTQRGRASRRRLLAVGPARLQGAPARLHGCPAHQRPPQLLGVCRARHGCHFRRWWASSQFAICILETSSRYRWRHVRCAEVEDCCLVLVSRQVRIHSTAKTLICLRVQSDPIVEHCTDVR